MEGAVRAVQGILRRLDRSPALKTAAALRPKAGFEGHCFRARFLAQLGMTHHEQGCSAACEPSLTPAAPEEPAPAKTIKAEHERRRVESGSAVVRCRAIIAPVIGRWWVPGDDGVGPG